MICMASPSVLPTWNRLLEVRWVHSSSASYVTNNDVHWRSLCTGPKLARASAGKETELRPLNLEKKNVLVYCGTNGRGMWNKWSDWTTAFMVVTRNIMLHLRVGFFEDWMYERIPILLCVFTKRSMNHQCNMDSVRLLTMAQGSSRGSVTHRPTMGPSGGFCSYNGERRSHVLKRNSPLEGPGEHHLYLFNNAKQNPLFMVFYQHFMNLLLNSSSYFTRFFFKMYHMNGIFKHSASWIYTLALLTFNFYNCSHVDMYDCHPELVGRKEQERE